MIFVPWGNETHPCSALEARELSRPPISQTYYDANLGSFVLYVIWTFVLLAGVIKYRNHSRFIKIRPLSVSLVLTVATLLYISGCTIAFAFNAPCIYIIFAQLFGLSLNCGTMVVRSVVISLEAQYAKLVAANRVEALDTDSTDAESQSKHSTSHQTKLDQVSYQFQALFTLVGLVFGTRKIADVPLQEIIVAKSSFALFTLFYVAPGILVILIVVFASAPILYCSAHCNEMFLDMQLGIIAVLGFFMVFCLKIIYLMYQMVGRDDKGLLFEMVGAVMGTGAALVVAMVLAIVDPYDMALNREANWQAVQFVGGVLYTWVSFGHQILQAYLQDRRAAKEDARQGLATVIKLMVPILEQYSDVRKEFNRFSVKHYVVESIQFLEDVAQFKRLFYEKGDNWRAQKVNLLIKNYIKVGTTLEINISSSVRERILQRVVRNKINQDSYDIFDEAYEQVKEIIQNGVWREFVRRYGVTPSGFGGMTPGSFSMGSHMLKPSTTPSIGAL